MSAAPKYGTNSINEMYCQLPHITNVSVLFTNISHSQISTKRRGPGPGWHLFAAQVFMLSKMVVIFKRQRKAVYLNLLHYAHGYSLPPITNPDSRLLTCTIYVHLIVSFTGGLMA